MEPGETYNLRSNTRNMDGEEDSETSEAESDATNPSYATDPEQLFQDERFFVSFIILNNFRGESKSSANC